MENNNITRLVQLKIAKGTDLLLVDLKESKDFSRILITHVFMNKY
jgi:hypothetical protein